MPSRYKPPSTTNIRRIDGKKSHGYQVHIERDGQVTSKHFSDSQYASPAQARKAAIVWRDEMYKQLPPSSNQRGARKTANSNTGFLGVTVTYARRAGGVKKPYITASVRSAPHKSLNKKFSIDDLGMERAVEEARAWREGILAERAQNFANEQARLAAISERKQQRKQAKRRSDDAADANVIATDADRADELALADEAESDPQIEAAQG